MPRIAPNADTYAAARVGIGGCRRTGFSCHAPPVVRVEGGRRGAGLGFYAGELAAGGLGGAA